MATILIVDDRPTNREVLVALLGFYGHRLIEAIDGLHGLEIARAEHPELIISDLFLPNLDGFYIVCELRAYPTLPICPHPRLDCRPIHLGGTRQLDAPARCGRPGGTHVRKQLGTNLFCAEL